jgi:hypothetical protein
MISKTRIYLIVLFAAGNVSACTSLPSRLHDTGVRIEPVLNDGAEVRSAGFWTNDEGIMLRGEVVANAFDNQPLPGHVDVAITVPDGSNTVCTVAEFLEDRQTPVNTYSRRFEALPPEASKVRVAYHAGQSHSDCVR